MGYGARLPSELSGGQQQRVAVARALVLALVPKVLLPDEGGMFIRNGSGALSLAYVAAERLAAYREPHMNAWDCFAGILLIEEAGGWIVDPAT